MIYVRCNSHRCREKLFRVLGRSAQCYWTMRRGPDKGIYYITADEYAQARGIKGLTRLRGPYDDIHMCW